MTERRWQNRRITPTKAQHAIDAIMVIVQTKDWDRLDFDTRAAIHGACAALTSIRDSLA